ncbi:pyridoxamine 5'-phosphate oxidase family protein [Fictibacillus fluitans]|uniref:Pyridoxamine 5'-phosphate oxidase family protein n=1 Tax=Fictibacillus fluitans TaxID=3058422 RepID=A0ABT8HUS4_9BACL|nr:pyridoxamine 5'-phosphate oxidase family protein [Fictibacillus sp. NE201]MDN4524527.1 pyridoxamine 5'-phosphate oxidase family protein [Fictibacillus sp. NE201]
MEFQNLITTEEQFQELQAHAGSPSIRAANKVIDRLDAHCVNFISKSPFLSLATYGPDGCCDVSPRGDQPGFVTVLSEQYLFIPERKGNNRLDSAKNILKNPGVGLLFMIPGMGETLRINGKAMLTRDSKLLEQDSVKGNPPLFGVIVKAEECFIHCAKAFIRSGIWDPQTWLSKELLPSAAAIMAAHMNLPAMGEEQVAEGLKESYQTRLY